MHEIYGHLGLFALLWCDVDSTARCLSSNEYEEQGGGTKVPPQICINSIMKAYQIVDLTNPVSVEYHEISKQSFQPAIDEGLIEEIIPVQAITPTMV